MKNSNAAYNAVGHGFRCDLSLIPVAIHLPLVKKNLISGKFHFDSFTIASLWYSMFRVCLTIVQQPALCYFGCFCFAHLRKSRFSWADLGVGQGDRDQPFLV